MPSIDLNADLGEHEDASLDEQIMPFLSSCNIACGGHAGNDRSIRETVRLAKRHGVAIGAHPSFPDRENFGRVQIEIAHDELHSSLVDQISWIARICVEEEVPLRHVKPHGALYNAAARDIALSDLICSAITSVDQSLKLFGLAHSIMAKAASKAGLLFVAEAFADRRYEPDRSLMSRAKKGAVITDLRQVLNQVGEIVGNHRVDAEGWIALEAKTICLHGDTEGAVTLAERIHKHLVSKGVDIAAV